MIDSYRMMKYNKKSHLFCILLGAAAVWFINSAYPLLGPFLPPVLFDLLYALSHNFHYLRVNHACPCPSLHAACQENNAKLYVVGGEQNM